MKRIPIKNHMRRHGLALLITLTVMLAASACQKIYLQNFKQFEIMGYEEILFEDTTWSKGDSPYILEGNLFILPDVTLTIEPGTTVLLGKDVMISCQGQIVARGEAKDPIRISALGDAPWDRIDCFGGRLTEEGKPPVNTFHHCIVEGGRGITIRAGAVEVDRCELRNNRSTPLRLEYSSGRIVSNEIYGNSTLEDTASGNGAGIMVYTDKTVLIAENEVHGNTSHGGRDGGGGIYAYAYDTGSVRVENNRIHDNTSDRHGGGLVAYACEVFGNILRKNKALDSGGGIYAIRSRLVENTIEENRAVRGGGLYAENSEIRKNALLFNQAPPGGGKSLFFFGEGGIVHNTFVQVCSDEKVAGEALLISGNPEIQGNNILAGSNYSVRVQSHSLGGDLNASGNYWGSRDPAVIGASIYDWLKDSTVGLVDWHGWSPSPMPQAPPYDCEPCGPVLPVTSTSGEHAFSGRLEKDVTLGDAAGAVYNVNGNVLVPAGVHLRVLPGTRLDVAESVTFRIRGRLSAVGKKGKPIHFTGDAQKPWGALLFENRSTDRSEDQEANKSGILRHCIIECGEGIVMEATGPRIENCVIRKHRGSGITVRDAAVSISGSLIAANSSGSNGGGVYIYGSKLVHLTGNEIRNNRAREDGGGIFAYGYRSTTAANLSRNLIEGNLSEGDGGGVWLSRSALTGNRIRSNEAVGRGGGLFATFALVEDNDIHDNVGFHGGGVFAEVNSSLEGNWIAGNRAKDSYGGGVFLNFWGVSIKNERFVENRVTGNTAAGEMDNGGVYLNGRMDFERNDIFENRGTSLYNANPGDQPPFKAVDCYWGTTDRGVIDAVIFDGNDDPGLGRVDYEPFSRKPVVGRVAPNSPAKGATR